jgi:hypothetical protein
MNIKSLTFSLLAGLLMIVSLPIVAARTAPRDAPGYYAFMVYYGKMTRNTLGQVVGGECELDDQKLYSAELSYIFTPDQGMRRYFGVLFQSIEANFNFTYHDDHGEPIYEFVPYLSFRWNKFPWNNYLKTSIGVGEGVSWMSHVSTREYANSVDPQKILNYLSFEVTAAMACYPQLELVARSHHRSGVFGMYRANNSGSTALGLGLRWYFDL